MASRSRLPILSLVVSVLAVLLVIYEGACFGATLFRGFPLADCVGHNGLVLINLTVFSRRWLSLWTTSGVEYAEEGDFPSFSGS